MGSLFLNLWLKRTVSRTQKLSTYSALLQVSCYIRSDIKVNKLLVITFNEHWSTYTGFAAVDIGQYSSPTKSFVFPDQFRFYDSV